MPYQGYLLKTWVNYSVKANKLNRFFKYLADTNRPESSVKTAQDIHPFGAKIAEKFHIFSLGKGGSGRESNTGLLFLVIGATCSPIYTIQPTVKLV